METKVRRESQSLTQKVFNEHEVNGSVKSDQVLDMMKQMTPDGTFDKSELDSMIDNVNREGKVDWGGFNKIALHFILKHRKQDDDQFIHKHEIGDKDFQS